MIKILHSGDWHLDAPMQGRSPEQAAFLRSELAKLPRKIADLCMEENCDLMLLGGDLFDGAYSQQRSFGRKMCIFLSSRRFNGWILRI